MLFARRNWFSGGGFPYTAPNSPVRQTAADLVPKRQRNRLVRGIWFRTFDSRGCQRSGFDVPGRDSKPLTLSELRKRCALDVPSLVATMNVQFGWSWTSALVATNPRAVCGDRETSAGTAHGQQKS